MILFVLLLATTFNKCISATIIAIAGAGINLIAYKKYFCATWTTFDEWLWYVSSLFGYVWNAGSWLVYDLIHAYGIMCVLNDLYDSDVW